MSLPPLSELLPHAGPMRLLARVVAHDAEETRCEVDVARAALFRDASGRVPPWVALEWLAQCVAAHAGLLARARGERPRTGLLLGTRRLALPGAGFAPGRRLVAVARPLRAGTSGAGTFGCRLEELEAPEDAPEAPALAEGTLTVYAPESLEGPAGAGGAGGSAARGSGPGARPPSAEEAP